MKSQSATKQKHGDPFQSLRDLYINNKWARLAFFTLLGLFILVALKVFFENRTYFKQILLWAYDESGILGLCVSFFALLITLKISGEQEKQIRKIEDLNMNIDDHVLGTLRGFDHVMNSLVDLLDEANRQRGSSVFFMAYWLWFGADAVLSEGSRELSNTSSPVWQRLRGRIAADQETTVVIFSDRDKIKSFVTQLIEYRFKFKFTSEEDKLQLVDKTVDQYMNEVTWIINEKKRGSSNLMLKLSNEIPALIFAIEGSSHAGIWFIGETAMLAQGTQLGGFKSRSPGMVAMLIDQVKHFSGLYDLQKNM